MVTRLRLADVLAAFSIVADLGYSLPPGEAVRSSILATRLARVVGLDDRQTAEAMYTALLRHIGCIGFAHINYTLVGDDHQGNRASQHTDFADARSLLTTMLPMSTSRLPTIARVRAAARIAAGGSKIGTTLETSSCEVAQVTARRVGLSSGVQRSLHEVMEWWNGKGNPNGLEGDEIALPARVARVAAEAVMLQRISGSEGGLDELLKRSGTVLDPDMVRRFIESEAWVRESETDDPREQLLAAEPQPVIEITSDRLPVVAEAFADLIDLKAPFMQGHSRGVASLARTAAGALGLDDATTDALYVAALLHDLGRAGVSNRVWEKPGPLTSIEWEEVRMHTYHSERIVSTSRTLEHLAPIVGTHHERLDGSGYHRSCGARDLTMPARVLECADAFHAMTEARPYRDPMPAEAAARELAEEATAGRLDADAAAAVIEAAGQASDGVRRESWPLGLSEREVEVLRLVAEGCANADIAERLFITRRTAEHHVQHVYTKIGVSSRAAAALLALEHGLLTPASPTT